MSVIGIGLLSTIGGYDSFSGMADFAQCHLDDLAKFFALPHGAPSHDTFQRIFDALNPSAFLECFTLFTEHLATAVKGLTVIDGKTIRHRSKNGNNLHIVSAWCDENRLVLGHVATHSAAGSEVTAMKQLLSLLDLSNRTISVDALGCQREIARTVVESDGDYSMALKQNQKNLLEDVKEYFKDLELWQGSEWQEIDKGHGRIEKGSCWVVESDEYLKHHEWPHLRTIALVKSSRTVKGKETVEYRYYISSLKADAETLCKVARRHWSIENKLHWVLDVTFNEDKGCIRNDNAAENIHIIRKWSLNVINKYRKKGESIRSVQRKGSMSFRHMVKILENAFIKRLEHIYY